MKSLECILLNILLVNVANVYSQGIEISSSAYVQSVGNARIEIIEGNFINNGTYIKGTENFIFSGVTAKEILGSSDTEFHDLTLNNSGGLTHSSTGQVSVDHTLIFSKGIFSTGSNVLIINNTATATGANTTQYIDGYCRKIGNQSFVFPLGNNAKYAPIEISAPTNPTDHFTAIYKQENTNSVHDISLLSSPLLRVSSGEYWNLERTNGTSDVSVSLYWDNTSGVSEINDLRLARWNGSEWADAGTFCVSGDALSGKVTSISLSAFGDFTIGSTSNLNVLPITLLSFKSYCADDYSIIQWVTSSEINNESFIVEKSYDGIDFSFFNSVLGAGNSNQTNEYALIDTETSRAKVYYRLKQIDFSGKVTVYDQNICYNDCFDNSSDVQIMIKNNNDLLIKSNLNADATFQLFDLSGKLLMNRNIQIHEGDNGIACSQLNLISGYYLANIQTETLVLNQKLWIK